MKRKATFSKPQELHLNIFRILNFFLWISVKFSARDTQLDILKEGETVTLMNAHAKVIHGYMRLEVDKWGIVKPAADADKLSGEVNTENN